MTIEEQAWRYISKIPGAISGQNGHSQTFEVARYLVYGFALGIDRARPLFSRWNSSCQPPWSDSELEHKLREAESKPFDKPRGFLINSRNGYESAHGVRVNSRGDPVLAGARVDRSNALQSPVAGPAAWQRSYVHQGPATPTSAAVAPATYALSKEGSLPAAMEDPTRTFLRAVFQPTDGVRIAKAVLSESGHEIPDGAGTVLSRDEWLEKLDKVNGEASGIWYSSDGCGVYCSVNPMVLGGSKDDDCTDFRYALIEFDSISVQEQYALYCQSRLPCACLIFSGGKSLHAWVRVNAKSLNEFREKVSYLYNHFANYKPDNKNRNPSRFSRLPGVSRFGNYQELIAVNVGCDSWDEWLQFVADEQSTSALPKIVDITQDEQLQEPELLIKPILHRCCKLSLGGSSKSYKSWTLLDMSISVATGAKFLGFETTKSKVLFVNLEIPHWAIQHRIKKIESAKGVKVESGMLSLWTLRGHCEGWPTLLPAIKAKAKDKGYGLIVLDPIYKILDGEENSPKDVGRLLAAMERMQNSLNCSLAFGAHFSKGNQGEKDSIDRVSGTGVWSRDPDSIITFTKHEKDDSFIVQTTLRCLPQIQDFTVTWTYPLFHVSDLDASAFRKSNAGRKKNYTVDDAIDMLVKFGPMSAKDWQKKISEERGVSRTGFYTLKKMLEDAKKVTLKDGVYSLTQKDA